MPTSWDQNSFFIWAVGTWPPVQGPGMSWSSECTKVPFQMSSCPCWWFVVSYPPSDVVKVNEQVSESLGELPGKERYLKELG